MDRFARVVFFALCYARFASATELPEYGTSSVVRWAKVITQPSGARGGHAFDVQPVLVCLDGDNKLVHTDAYYPGATVHAHIRKNPTMWATASLVDSEDPPVVEVVDGIANFTNLTIDLVGEGYTLTYLATIWFRSKRMNLTSATAIPTTITQHVGNAFGGTPLARSLTRRR